MEVHARAPLSPIGRQRVVDRVVCERWSVAAAAEYLRWIEHDRARKPSTVRDYHSIIKAHLLPAFGDMRLEDITTEGVERWAAGLTVGGRMNNRTKLKILTVLHGVMKRAKRVWKLPRNPITDIEKPDWPVCPTSSAQVARS